MGMGRGTEPNESKSPLTVGEFQGKSTDFQKKEISFSTHTRSCKREKGEFGHSWEQHVHSQQCCLGGTFFVMLKIRTKYPNQGDLWSLSLTLITFSSQLTSPVKSQGHNIVAHTKAKLETYRSNLTAILMTPEMSSADSPTSSGVLAKRSARRASSSRVVSS